MSKVISISDAEFESEVLQAQQPVLVYLWASWCGPCRLVSPSVDAIAQNYSDRLKVVKMEVDPNPETVKQYKVEGVPAIRLFKEQELVESMEGAITKQKLESLLAAHI
ncbi:Thioredoxin domain-containing protein [Crinalium epipsammum PCC 9333]|uniref:Thioredoxin n=1 Tax=Crinalium epipsammum PCC 9333 TaxID=1173022 RepID=K9W4E1_9CYAN|nr:thioredoxin family protein [Crinalium epipsammum]AFZ14664.1 Thioredoxin domain-containing protein [Crinalium epipsammum PCC 9333]